MSMEGPGATWAFFFSFNTSVAILEVIEGGDMRKIFLLTMVIVFASTCLAWSGMQTDFKCMSDCMAKGYMYNYCKSECSYELPDRSTPSNPYNTNPYNNTSQPHGTDYKCMNDCTSKGYMYNYCKSACSY